MATTLRLPPELAADATAYAAKLGISVNALSAVALREYIDGRVIRRSDVPVEIPNQAAGTLLITPESKPPALAVGKLPFRPPKSRSDPCPCGARNSDGNPLRFKQCHGKSTT